MTASGSEAGIDGLGTVSETKSKLEQMRRSPQGTPKKPSRRRRVIGRGLLRHAVSSERCSSGESERSEASCECET